MALCLLNNNFNFPYKIQICVISMICFLVGITIMLIYYWAFHPNKDCKRRKEISLKQFKNFQIK